MESGNFQPVHHNFLLRNTIINFDLFGVEGGKYNLIRRSFLPVIDELFKEIEENTAGKVYIRNSDLENYQAYLEENLDAIVNNKGVSVQEKASMLIDIGKRITKQVYGNPKNIDYLKRCHGLINNLITYLDCNENALLYFEEVIPDNYQLHVHCLNVSILSLALGMEMGIKDSNELIDLGLGALLHDVGMTIVPQVIRSKTDKLTDREYIMIRKHVSWGANILEESKFLSKKALIPIWQHHERIDGNGYPFRIRGDELDLFGKISAITVVFDALNTNRPYRKAISSFPALKEMISIKGAFDPKVLTVFVKMMGGK
ncbi:MAG: HD domain-containing protein [candidate division Zixibacteria bacterium]|nr:HD domain-containing protein [candidate division Zixibacteria bacterium]